MNASGPDMPGKPGEVRLFRLFCHRGAVRVNEPRKERVFVVIDACQAPPGKHGGDRGLPGASTAGNQHCAHRCLSSAIVKAAQRVCGPAGDGWTDVNRRGHPADIHLSDLGAGKRDRTADLPFTRSTASCTECPSCTDTAGHRTDCTRCTGTIRRAVPQTVPHGRQAMVHDRNRAAEILSEPVEQPPSRVVAVRPPVADE
jgi:hypothetical protein